MGFRYFFIILQNIFKISTFLYPIFIDRSRKMIPTNRKPSIYLWCTSIFLIFIASFSIGFTYWMYPTLVPMYGGGERFNLAEYNNYTENFPFSAATNLSITMEANDTVQILINNESVFNGTFYQLEIEGNRVILITLKSNSPVSGRFTLRQESPMYMEIFSIGAMLLGVISLLMNLYFYKKK